MFVHTIKNACLSLVLSCWLHVSVKYLGKVSFFINNGTAFNSQAQPSQTKHVQHGNDGHFRRETTVYVYVSQHDKQQQQQQIYALITSDREKKNKIKKNNAPEIKRASLANLMMNTTRLGEVIMYLSGCVCLCEHFLYFIFLSVFLLFFLTKYFFFFFLLLCAAKLCST